MTNSIVICLILFIIAWVITLLMTLSWMSKAASKINALEEFCKRVVAEAKPVSEKLRKQKNTQVYTYGAPKIDVPADNNAEYSKEFMTLVKDRASELGLTMKELAERVGASQGTVSSWFAFKHVPTTPYFSKLAFELGIASESGFTIDGMSIGKYFDIWMGNNGFRIKDVYRITGVEPTTILRLIHYSAASFNTRYRLAKVLDLPKLDPCTYIPKMKSVY